MESVYEFVQISYSSRMDDQFSEVMERIRLRQAETRNELKENEVVHMKVKQEETTTSPSKILGNSTSNRFSALAQQFDDFNYDDDGQELKRIKFAELPSECDMSTVLGGSAEMMNVTTSSLSYVTHENSTVVNTLASRNLSNDEYGAHTFLRKKVPNLAKPTLTTLPASPKPSRFSPVHFTPQSTSSPKSAPEVVLFPSKNAALQGSVARTRMAQFEQKLQNSAPIVPVVPVPQPRSGVSHKKELFPPAVVQGARAEDKTASSVIGAGVGRLKNLKSRWEFSSATGTPIHPDSTEDSLIATAIRMKETKLPMRRLEEPFESEKTPEKVEEEKTPEKNEEELPIDEESGEEEEIPFADTSRFIDHAFGFMEGTATPSPFRAEGAAPLAMIESPETPKVEEKIEHKVEEEEQVDTVVEQQKNESASLPYSVSFYRKIQRERVNEPTIPLSSLSPLADIGAETPSQSLRERSSQNETEDVKETEERLQTALRVEEALVAQSKRAMAFSREKASFRGSREEFEAQWALLVHVEKQRALVGELQRLRKDGPRRVDGPRGTVAISRLTVSLASDYITPLIASSKRPEELFYLVAVLRCGEHVDVSKMVTSDGALNRKRSLEFPVPLQLSQLPADFRATVEIYGQRSMREAVSHEDKFKLKGSTLKTKTRNAFLGGSSSSANTSVFVPSSPSAYSSDGASNFNLLGSFSFDINCPHKKTYEMAHPLAPLDGAVTMKVRKQAMDGSDVRLKGFLSMYQRTAEGLGSWTRFWCVLENGEMRFWRQPEDEDSKGWLVLMDLSTSCRSEGASLVQDICPYPNSFNIDVWVPKEEAANETADATIAENKIEQLRVMMAADTQSDLSKWLSAINTTTKQLCTWRNPIIQ